MAASSSKGFNYDKSKQRYMELLNEQLANPIIRRELGIHFEENIRKRINEIRKQKALNIVDRDFDVITRDGVEILVKKRPKSEAGARILSFEDIFEKFMELHLRDNHAPRKKLLENVSVRRDVFPNICIELLVEACDVCNKSYASEIIEQALLGTKGKNSVVYVISISQQREDQHCHYLLIHVDTATNYILLRPMMEKNEKEIALTLFQIFTQFGPPLTLSLSGFEPALAEEVNSLLKTLCPMFQVEVKHTRMDFVLPTLVVQKLVYWRDNSKSDFWELGCSIVQKDLNDMHARNPIRDKVYAKPYELYFTELIKDGN